MGSEQSGEDLQTSKLRKNFFPAQMMQILSSSEFEDCISWNIDGTGFYFTHQDKFSEKISEFSPRKITHGKKSFIRKLNRWGFKMSLKKGPTYGVYCHRLFQRDKPWLCEMMACEKRTKNYEIASDLAHQASKNRITKRKRATISVFQSDKAAIEQSKKERR